MAIPLVTLYTDDIPSLDNDQDEFNTNINDALAYGLTVLGTDINATVGAINSASSDIDASAAAAETSADESAASAAEAAASAAAAAASTGVTVYSDLVTYNYPDTVVGSDSNTYRCTGTGVIGDDPVGSATGDWKQLTVDIDTVISLINKYKGM